MSRVTNYVRQLVPFCFGALLVLPGVTQAQTKAEAPRVTDIAKWQVFYQDAMLGTVEGKAVVDWDNGRVSLHLTHPSSQQQYHLVAFDVTWPDRNNFVTMTLEGKPPAAPSVTLPPSDGLPRIEAAEDSRARVDVADGDVTFLVKPTGRPDLDKVRVQLEVGTLGVMSGAWSYFADPMTQRDRNGGGRAGHYRLVNKDELENDEDSRFIALQAGDEIWWPLPPEIVSIAVLEDQLKYRGPFPVYSYPFGGSEHSPAVLAELTRRTLMIVGRNLPIDKERVLGPIDVSKEPGIKSYRILAISTDPNLDEDTKSQFEMGWKKILDAVPADQQPAIHALDAVLAAVELGPEVLPGPKELRWKSGRGSWLLQFRDATALGRFVRPLREQTASDPTSSMEVEPTELVFLPERVQIEIDTGANLPLTQLSVQIKRKGLPESEQTFIAQRVGPGLYRTAPVLVTDQLLVGPAGTLHFNAKVGDEILATVDGRKDLLEFVTAPLAKARAVRTPGATGRDTFGTLWKDALTKSARCKGIAVTDFSTLPGQELERITETIVFDLVNIPLYGKRLIPRFKRESIPVTVGDHAAMLLLRGMFIEMMKTQEASLDDLDKNESGKMLRGYRELLKPQILANSNSEFAQLEVRGPDRGTVPYYKSLDDDYRSDIFSGDNGASRRLNWQLQATKDALTKFRQAIVRSRKRASAIDACDSLALLQLTGPSFEAVAAQLQPRLMKLQDAGSPPSAIWVPDRVARAAVGGVRPLAEAVTSIKEYSNADTRLAVVGASVLPATWSYMIGGALGRIVFLAWNVLLWEVESAHEIYENFKNRDEIQFEFGASAVLGNERLEAAELKKSEWWQSVTKIAAQAALIGLDAWGVYHQFGQEMAIFRGKNLVPILQRRGGFIAFRELPVAQQRDVLAYLADIRIRSGSSGALDIEDVRALVNARRSAEEVRGPPAAASDRTAQAAETAVAPTFESPGHLRIRTPRASPGLESPAPNTRWVGRLANGDEVEFQLAERLGGGSSGDVYVLLDDNGKAFLKEGKPTVIKIFHPQSGNTIDTDAMEVVAQRIKRAQELLEEAGIEHLKIYEIEAREKSLYLIQEKLELGPDVRRFDIKDLTYIHPKVRRFPILLPYEELTKKFPKELQVSIPELYSRIGAARMKAVDLSMPNIYFKRKGGKWVAGVLDIDHIISVNDVPVRNATYNWIEQIQQFPVLKGIYSTFEDSVSSEPMKFMEKMLEFSFGGNLHSGFISFDTNTGMYEPVLIDLDMVKGYFPGFKPQLKLPPNKQGLSLPRLPPGVRASVPAVAFGVSQSGWRWSGNGFAIHTKPATVHQPVLDMRNFKQPREPTDRFSRLSPVSLPAMVPAHSARPPAWECAMDW